MRLPPEISPAAALAPLVTREELNAWIGISQDVFEEDVNLNLLADAVTEHIVAVTGQVHVSSTWTYRLSRFPKLARPIPLPLAPVVSVDSFSYTDDQDAPQALAGTLLWGDLRQFISPARGENWPTAVATRYPRNITIGLTIGPAVVPPWAKLAARQLAAHWFEYRSGHQDLEIRSVPYHVERVLRANRIPDHFEEYV